MERLYDLWVDVSGWVWSYRWYIKEFFLWSCLIAFAVFVFLFFLAVASK